MSSKLLLAGSVISAITCIGHTQLGFKLAPAFAGLSWPADHCALNGWYQVSGYLVLAGIFEIGEIDDSRSTGSLGQVWDYDGL
jgi:hypothetical protein